MGAAIQSPESEVGQAETARQPALVHKPAMEWKPLFSDCLLEGGGMQRRRRSFSTAVSFSFQAVLVAVALIVPLMFTSELPRQQLLTFLVAPPPPPPPPPPAAAPVKIVRQMQSDIMNGELRTPARIPSKVQMIKEEAAPPPLTTGEGVVGGVPGGVPGGQLGGVIGGIISSTSHLNVPKLVKPTPQRIRISQGVTAGLLVHKIEPIYPTLARQARIQGQVLLSAIISKEGAIENLQVVRGHPMLVPAAIEAVKQWRYRPYLLNGQPVEVETEIIVTFTLS
ncbi:MAG TPA: energy transducer TonB [Terriglobales bacterium]|nr:energy transducer TonB [Terriglobales bacterium]